MKLLYQISVLSYSLIIHLASFSNKKAKQWVEGRKNIFIELEKVINPEDKIAWFHCASLGEFEQGKPVIEAFKNKHLNHKIFLTFFSPSGYELRKNYEGADYVFYLPIDTYQNAKQFISIVKPNIAFFVKYEFWFFYLQQLRLTNTPVYLISGVFRNDQLFFKWYGAWYQNMLGFFNHFFLQNQESAHLLKSIGHTNFTVSGDTRFDRVYQNSLNAIELPILRAFKDNTSLLLVGSSWQPEEKIVASYLQKNNSKYKVVIAPHDISEKHIKNIESLFKKNCVRYSNASLSSVSSKKVLIIDNIGILAHAYQYADIAFIGGGFSGALHNILEPACFGNAIIFGPYHKKFHEAQAFINNGGAFSVNDLKSFENTINSIQSRKDTIKNLNLSFVKDNIGATNSIINAI